MNDEVRGTMEGIAARLNTSLKWMIQEGKDGEVALPWELVNEARGSLRKVQEEISGDRLPEAVVALSGASELVGRLKAALQSSH